MKPDEIAELKRTADGGYQFRLLSRSMNKIHIENAIISVKEPDYVFTNNAEGVMIETPNVPVEFHVGSESIKKIFTPGDPTTLGGWSLKLLYAFSGETSPLFVESAIHFMLKKV